MYGWICCIPRNVSSRKNTQSVFYISSASRALQRLRRLSTMVSSNAGSFPACRGPSNGIAPVKNLLLLGSHAVVAIFWAKTAVISGIWWLSVNKNPTVWAYSGDMAERKLMLFHVYLCSQILNPPWTVLFNVRGGFRTRKRGLVTITYLFDLIWSWIMNLLANVLNRFDLWYEKPH